MATKPIQQRIEEILALSVRPVALAQFSKNAVCVYDNWGDWDIFFDASKYEIVNTRWAEHQDVALPEDLKQKGLGMLRGGFFRPAVRGFYNAFDAARDVLKPIEPEKWFESFEVLYQNL